MQNNQKQEESKSGSDQRQQQYIMSVIENDEVV